VAQLLLGLAQLIVAVLLSTFAAYLAFYLFQWFTQDLDEKWALGRGNAAVGVVLGAMLVSVAIVLRPALLVQTDLWDVGTDLFFRVLLSQALRISVGLVLAVIALVLAIYLFTTLTRGLDETQELRNGNMAVAGLMAGVVIGVGLLVGQAVSQIMDLLTSLLF
jgi:uncharacterized membrane protein YjfL (UPF0719 family)